MKSNILFSIAFVTLAFIACKKDNPSQSGEVWPKEGYLFTTNDLGDTVFVESGNFAVTSNYNPSFPLNEPELKWKISLPSSGEGVVIHNSENIYWSIDSTFHPGLNVEQHFVDVVTKNDPATITDFNRFRFHHSGNNNTFYLESVRFPGFYVTGLGHAESGRGLRFRSQSNGIWEFWIQQQ